MRRTILVTIAATVVALTMALNPSWSQEAAKAKGKAPEQPSSSIQPEEVTVTNAVTGQQFAVKVFRPTEFDRAKGKKYPALLVQGSLAPFGVRDVADVVEKGIVVVYGEPPLPPQEGEESESARRFSPRHMDNFNSVAKHLASMLEVDAGNIGMVSFSGGCMLAAGALAQHPDDPKVKYWIDGEGPSDRYVVCCAIAGSEARVRAGTGTEMGAAFSRQAWGVELCDDGYWNQREAFRNMDKITCRYLRLQAETDHVQNWFFGHAIHMLNAAVGKACPWTRCNSGPVNAHHTSAKTLDILPGRIQEHPDKFLAYLQEMISMPPL